MGDELEIKEPDGGEKKATPPSSVSDGIKKFMDKQSALKEKAEKAAPDADKDTQLSKEGGEKGAEKPQKKIRIVDESGNDVPFEITVDGKLIQVTDTEKLKKYSQLGYHSDIRGKEQNDRELLLKEKEDKLQQEIGAFRQGQELLGKIQKAIEEGRLSLNDPSAGGKNQEPEIDEELFADPGMIALKKENIETQKALKSMKEQLETTNKILLGKLVEEQHIKINDDIERLKPSYGLADQNKVWDLLALQNKDGAPVHTVESAMKISHEEEKAKFDSYVKSDPDFAKLSDDEKKEAIREYLEKKAEREKAPVSSPSGSPAGGASPKKEDRSKWTSRDYFAAGSKMVAERMAAAKKS